MSDDGWGDDFGGIGSDIDDDEADTEEETARETSLESGSVTSIGSQYMFYLPPEMGDRLSNRYKELAFFLDQEHGIDDFEKNRHYYPLVIKYGLPAVEEMELVEVIEKVQEEVSWPDE